MQLDASVLGVAHLGTMCDRRHSTALSMNLLPLFIVSIVAAHELGHIFNMVHDNIGMFYSM